MVSGFEHLHDEVVHRGFIWHVVTARFTSPDGEEFTRDVVRSPGAVGIVPLHIDAEGSAVVTLVRQYRPALDLELLEIPAGMRDVPGEPPESTAERELAEEVGLAAARLQLLTVMHPSAGMTDATTHVYLATGLRSVPSEAHGPEERAMTVVDMAFDRALEAVRSGEISDAKTVIGILLAAGHLGR
jgi:8-oxo-dGTP pyrophosphatase MutT (NUDIX family)